MKPASSRVLDLLGLLLLSSVLPLSAQSDPGKIHALEELKARTGPKPYERLLNGYFPSERTAFKDMVTGVEIWRLTNDAANDWHAYYDIPVWNRDGSMMILKHGSEIGGKTWLSPPDAAWLLPLGQDTDDPDLDMENDFFSGEIFWSRLDPDLLYLNRAGVVSRFDWRTLEITELKNLPAEISNFQGDILGTPPHPLDDRLLYYIPDRGRFFSFFPDNPTAPLQEMVTQGQWDTPDGIHRVRWTKDVDQHVFLGQNNVLVGGQPAEEERQYWATMPGGQLLDCANPLHPEIRAGHPDHTTQGELLSGYYGGGELWLLDCDGPNPPRMIFASSKIHHSSETWDGRWNATDHYIDVPLDEQIRGLPLRDSIALISLDGRSQNLLGYHYSSYTFDENTHPAPASSPDGTKLVYDSDMLLRGTGGQSNGNADLWMMVIRPPDPPRDLTAATAGGTTTLTWTPAAHAAQELYWNQGNLAMETAGYAVLRASTSGGPYTQVSDGLVEGTSFVEAAPSGGASYYYVVQAVEHSGLASLYSNEVIARPNGNAWAGNVRHYYEAEYAAVDLPMVVQIDRFGASGDWYLGTFAAEPDPLFPLEPYPAAVTFDVTAPRSSFYKLWLRARAFDGAGTFSVLVDGVAEGDVTVSQDSWQWLEVPGTTELAPGQHTVLVETSDEELGIDVLAFGTRQTFVPAPDGNRDVQPAAVPQGLRVAILDATTKKIVWDPSPDSDVAYYNVYAGRDASYALDNTRIVRSPVLPFTFDWGIPAGWDTAYKVTAVDRDGNESEPAVFDPTVTPEEWAPIGFDDFYSLQEDETRVEAAPGILGNDDDPDGDVMTTILLEDVEHGTLDLATDGSFTYTPDFEYSGEDSFLYMAYDGLARSAPTTVTLTMGDTNDPPIAVDDFYNVVEDGNLTKVVGAGLLANDSDAENDPLTASQGTLPTHGTVTDLNSDGSFTYLPEDDYNGPDEFTYFASDGNSQTEATVFITVDPANDKPTVEEDEYSVNEDTVLIVSPPGVLANDFDIDGDRLTAVLDLDVEDGVLTLAPNGRFRYIPDPNFEGIDKFWYRADDGEETSILAKVTITVLEVNDPPVALPDSYSGTANSPLSINATSGVLANDSDIDSGQLSTVLVANPQNGTLTLNANGSFLYNPDPGFQGDDSFSYRASDGIDESDVTLVTITIGP